MDKSLNWLPGLDIIKVYIVLKDGGAGLNSNFNLGN